MESAVQIIVGKLGQLVADEIRKARAVSGEVVHLKNELATMNAALLMLSEADDSAVDHLLKEWGRQVRDLAFDIEDCIDIFKYRVSHFRRLVFVVSYVYQKIRKSRLRSSLFEDVQDLRARAVIIGECHARYVVTRHAMGVGARSANYSDPIRPVAQSSTYVGVRRSAANGSCQFVGNKEQVNILCGKLLSVTQERDNETKAFSILGFGGIGKTMLAKEVGRQLEGEFDLQAQVSVSQAFDGKNDLKRLMQRLIQQILKAKTQDIKLSKSKEEEDNLSKEEEDDNLSIQEKYSSHCDIDNMTISELRIVLWEGLQDKRCLIIIDDVWTVAAWNAIKSMLSYDKNRIRIIVTTRVVTVAEACSLCDMNYIYVIKAFDPEDSKKLFLSRAFGRCDANCSSELEEAMVNILKKCAGLPLAIASIASLLASTKSIDMWQRVWRSIDSHMEPSIEGMMQILTLSYNHLPHHLKSCMMLLCIFPEDYVISKNKLLNRWIVEGLVAEKRGLTLMEVAEGYYYELISRSMIDGAGDIDGYLSEETCQLHDMMLEVLMSKSLEVNFVSLVGGSQYVDQSYDRIRRLSIHGDECESRPGTSNSFERMDMQHVRSLTSFSSKLGLNLLDRLGECTLLSVLDLEDCKGLQNKHLKDICRMYLLRYLCLRGTDISVVPDKVGELEHLQTLDVRATYLDRLPDTVIKLEKLERLLFSNRTAWYVMWTPPQGLWKMKALREVGWVVIKDDAQVAREISELENLQQFRVCVDCDGPNDVLLELAVSLGKMHFLQFLYINDVGYGRHTMNFLLNLDSAPQLLRFLRIGGGLSELPSWVGSLAFLVEFHMSWACLADDQIFSVLCKCPNLKTIGLERNCYVAIELVARSTFSFPELRNLDVSSDSEYPKVIRFEEGSMTKLEKLSVNFSSWNEKSIVGIKHLTNLKEVHLTSKKDNPALTTALEELKVVRDGLPESEQFKVMVTYE